MSENTAGMFVLSSIELFDSDRRRENSSVAAGIRRRRDQVAVQDLRGDSAVQQCAESVCEAEMSFRGRSTHSHFSSHSFACPFFTYSAFTLALFTTLPCSVFPLLREITLSRAKHPGRTCTRSGRDY